MERDAARVAALIRATGYTGPGGNASDLEYCFLHPPTARFLRAVVAAAGSANSPRIVTPAEARAMDKRTAIYDPGALEDMLAAHGLPSLEELAKTSGNRTENNDIREQTAGRSATADEVGRLGESISAVLRQRPELQARIAKLKSQRLALERIRRRSPNAISSAQEQASGASEHQRVHDGGLDAEEQQRLRTEPVNSVNISQRHAQEAAIRLSSAIKRLVCAHAALQQRHARIGRGVGAVFARPHSTAGVEQDENGKENDSFPEFLCDKMAAPLFKSHAVDTASWSFAWTSPLDTYFAAENAVGRNLDRFKRSLLDSASANSMNQALIETLSTEESKSSPPSELQVGDASRMLVALGLGNADALLLRSESRESRSAYSSEVSRLQHANCQSMLAHIRAKIELARWMALSTENHKEQPSSQLGISGLEDRLKAIVELELPALYRELMELKRMQLLQRDYFAAQVRASNKAATLRAIIRDLCAQCVRQQSLLAAIDLARSNSLDEPAAVISVSRTLFVATNAVLKARQHRMDSYHVYVSPLLFSPKSPSLEAWVRRLVKATELAVGGRVDPTNHLTPFTVGTHVFQRLFAALQEAQTQREEPSKLKTSALELTSRAVCALQRALQPSMDDGTRGKLDVRLYRIANALGQLDAAVEKLRVGVEGVLREKADLVQRATNEPDLTRLSIFAWFWNDPDRLRREIEQLESSLQKRHGFVIDA